MTATHDLERRLSDYYASEAPVRAPDWLLERSLDAIDQTKQQRPVIGALRRIPAMSTFSKLAAAAVVVIGVVAFGAMAFRPPDNVGSAATPSPSPSPVRTPGPSASNVAPSPPPLSETFTSTIHGYSIDHPAGWVAIPATTIWTGQVLNYGAAEGDTVHDATLEDHLFLGIASTALDGTPGEDWANDWLASPEAECGDALEPINIDFEPALLCGPGIAAAWTEDRGYTFRLYTSGDEWWLSDTYSKAWFEEVLRTIDLRPEDAADAAPSPSP